MNHYNCNIGRLALYLGQNTASWPFWAIEGQIGQYEAQFHSIRAVAIRTIGIRPIWPITMAKYS